MERTWEVLKGLWPIFVAGLLALAVLKFLCGCEIQEAAKVAGKGLEKPAETIADGMKGAGAEATKNIKETVQIIVDAVLLLLLGGSETRRRVQVKQRDSAIEGMAKGIEHHQGHNLDPKKAVEVYCSGTPGEKLLKKKLVKLGFSGTGK